MDSPKADKEGAMATRTVFVLRRRLECGAAMALVMIVTLMIGVVVWIRITTPEEPQEVLKVYNRLAWLSKSLVKMEGELLELDQILTENRMAVRLEDRMRFQREVSSLGRKYAETAGNYNRSMRESRYRFSDPAKLPPGAKFGLLPRRHEPFVLLKGGPRV